MTDDVDEPMEQRLRAAIGRLADAHEPVRPGVPPSAGSEGRRWLAVAAAAVLLVGAVVVVASVRRGDGTMPADQPTESPEPPPSVLEPVPSHPPPTPTTTTTVPVDVPSTVFDAAGRPLVTYDLAARRSGDVDGRSDFTEALLDHLLNRSTLLGDTYEQREDAVFRGGLSIHTTLDSEIQAAAAAALDALPANEAGIDAAIVTLDNRTGAIRAMVGGAGSIGRDRTVNMALVPRGTASTAQLFVLAAAVEAGAQADDLIDGTRGCLLPANAAGTQGFMIDGGVPGLVGTLRDMLERSVPCGTARLSHIVGLDRVVDTTYAMASSSYLVEGQSESVRDPISPDPGFALGSNAMSPLDMAAGVQTIANLGVHHEPFFVEYIDDADGERVFVRSEAGTRALEVDTASVVVDVLRGVLVSGTARRSGLDGGRPSFGKTGTIEDNVDAWFVGATRQLSTAVWVGDPADSTPMVDIPEFADVGVPRVAGGTFPAQIWKAMMDAAHDNLPVEDWVAPPPAPRSDVRLVLPGFECAPDGRELELDQAVGLPAVAVDAAVAPCDIDIEVIPVAPDPTASEPDD